MEEYIVLQLWIWVAYLMVLLNVGLITFSVATILYFMSTSVQKLDIATYLIIPFLVSWHIHNIISDSLPAFATFCSYLLL